MTDAQTEYNPDPDWFDERTSESELSEALREDTAEALDPESAAFIRFLVDKVWQFVVEFAGVESFPFPYQEEFGKRIVESLIIGDGSTITGEQSRQCLDGDTVIFRRDGTACRIRDHEDAWVTGEKPVKRYTFRGGASVVATDNHPFWTANGWVQAGQLQVGDKVATLDDWDRWAGKQFIRSTFERGRWKQQVLYERKITDSLCRLLGYFVADGSHRPGQSAKFTNITAQYLDEFDFMLEENFGFRAKWYAKGKGWDLLLTTDSKSSHDNDFRDFLHALRWDDGFPTDVFSWRRDQVAEFVNRAWSADGCIHIKQVNVSTSGQRSYPEIFMSCGNGEVYARYWQALLWKFGVSSTVKEEWMSKSTKPFFRLVVGGGERNVKRFFDSFGLIYGKEAKSSEALACAGKFSKSWGVDWVDVDGEQFHWSALLKVEELGVRQVWDVTYEGKGWFVGQGVKVSNSGKTELLANTIAGLMVLLPRLAVMYPKHLGKFKRGLWVGCFAPVESQVATLFGRVVDRLTSERALEIMSDPDIDEVPSANKSRELILKRSGSLVRMSTANPRAKIEGKSYHWIIIDEAQDVDEYVMNKCVAAGTPVWLPDGRVLPVEQVVAERLPVISYDRQWDVRDPRIGRPSLGTERDEKIGNLRPTLPVEWHDNGEQDVFSIRLASGRELIATATHSWVTRSRSGNRQMRMATTASLRPGMTLPQPRGVDFWGTDGTEWDGYFVGQMLGDGSTRGTSPVWCGHADAATEQMREYAEKQGCGLVLYNTSLNGLLEFGLTKPGPGLNPLTAYLRRESLWGLKGAEKALQRMDYSKEFFLGFLAGLLDSDGCASGQIISFTTISERLMRQVQDTLTKLGIYSFIQTRPNNGHFGAHPHDLWTVTVKGAEDVLRFRDLVDSRSKAAAVDKVAEKAAERSWSHRSSSDLRRGYNEGICWDRIVSVTPAGCQRTYCVTVEPSNLWVVNGVVTRNSISPMGAFYLATICKIGTPNVVKGDFYKSIQYNKRQELTRGGKKNHFRYPWEYCAKSNPNYKKYIKQEALKYGEDSDEFRLNYKLEWLLDRGMFLPENDAEIMGDTTQGIVDSYWKSPVVVGIDPARRMDSTVVTVVYVDWEHPDEFGFFVHRILNWLEIHGEDWEEQYFRIVDFLQNYNVLAVGVDAQGVGDAVAQRLQRLMPNTQVVSLMSSPKDQSERWKHLQALLQRRMIVWPAHPKTRRLKLWKRFMSQMTDLEKQYRGGYLLAEAPDEKGAHDDFPDSLALACVLTRDFVVPESEMTDAPWANYRRQ
jgi:intein/homing endonuclease